MISVCLVFFLAGLSSAQGPKIGVLDTKEFQEKSIGFKKIREELRGKFEALQQKLETEKNALMKLEEEFRKQSMMLSLDAKGDKRNELDKKRRYYKYLYEDLTEQMKNAERSAARRILKELEGVVKEIALQEGYTLILERGVPGLIYASDAINITDQVIKAYDSRNKQ
jgi:outer membrane protein